MVPESKLMDIQEIMVLVFFVGAVAYIGWVFYSSFFKPSKGCGAGCGSCNTVDFEAIEKELTKKTTP